MHDDPTRPWLAHYPAGIDWHAPLPEVAVTDLLDDAVRRWPKRPALEFMGRVIDYADFGALVDAFAAGLQRLGVGPGDHVGLYLPNTPHYPVAFFGALRAGATVVNYSPLDAERVLADKIEDSRTECDALTKLIREDLHDGAFADQLAKLVELQTGRSSQFSWRGLDRG